MTKTTTPVTTLDFSPLSGIEVLTQSEQCQPYGIGVRGEQGLPSFVMRPRSTEEVARCVRFCHAQGIAFVTQSANTGLVGASVPEASGQQAVLSVAGLNEAPVLDLENRSATVQAGVRLSALNQQAEREGLCFPIDLASDPMIGGMVATNTGGGRFLRFGDVRQQVLGLTVVLNTPEAPVLKLGADARKNNTGPDWKQSFIGTAGWFGVVTEATVNLEFALQQQAVALVVPQSAHSVLPLLRFLESRLGPTLSAFEWMSGNAMRHAFAHAPSVKNGFHAGEVPEIALLVELSRSYPLNDWEPSLDTVLEKVLSEAWELPDEPIADALFDRPHSLWALRHALSEGVRVAGDLVAFDLGFSRQGVLAFRQWMAAHLPQAFPEVEIADFGHVADGGLHFNLVLPKGTRTPERERQLRDWVVKQAVERFAGSYSAEHGIGPKNIAYYQQYSALPAETLKALASLSQRPPASQAPRS